VNPIFIFALHKAGTVDDTVAELLTVAKKINPTAGPIALVAGIGVELAQACEALQATFTKVWKIEHAECAAGNAEVLRPALVKIIPPESIVLLAHEHFAMDLAPGLSIKLGVPYVPDTIAVEATDVVTLKFVRQAFSGQFNSSVTCDASGGAVITIRPGAFKAEQPAPLHGEVIEKTSEIGTLAVRRRYQTTVPAAQGDVDITRQTVLVSVGRGIQDEENIAIAQELADVLGGAVSCSRPVVDAKWLDKSRQVGSSGATVKPKVYLACGISGSFQHMAGINGSPFLVAINKNPHAPIFQFADLGIVDDVLEFLPVLTERVREMTSGKSASAKTAIAK
jgi:electron transfer flavoprotein alpha subunit